MNSQGITKPVGFKSYIIDIFRKPFENPLVQKEDDF